MRLFSYVVTKDTGFAFNPFWGYCTLACCKPFIRKTAGIGDWIVGLSIRDDGNRIIYAMQVDEILTFAEYFNDPRFKEKIPRSGDADHRLRCGDNIYKPLPGGGYRQLPSFHSHGCDEDQDTKKHDLSSEKVLISETFHYFGSEAIVLPPGLEDLKVGRAHRCYFPEEVVKDFLAFIRKKQQGVVDNPNEWGISKKWCGDGRDRDVADKDELHLRFCGK